MILKDLKPRIRKAVANLIAKVLSKGNLDWEDLFPDTLLSGITAQINGGRISHRFVTICSRLTFLFLLINKTDQALNQVLIPKPFQSIKN